jgi:hypothetical protein
MKVKVKIKIKERKGSDGRGTRGKLLQLSIPPSFSVFVPPPFCLY